MNNCDVSFPYKLISYLRAPKTLEKLSLLIWESNNHGVKTGLLYTSSAAYPIYGGIPRFVWSDKTLKKFRPLLKKYLNEQELISLPIQKLLMPSRPFTLTQKMYNYQWTKLTLGDSALSKEQVYKNLEHQGFVGKKKLGLEIGAGNGRHSTHILDFCESLISLDFGDNIEIATQKNGFNPSLGFIQASALEIPLENNTIDLLFTTGVLMCSPSTEMAFQEATRVISHAGILSCWVYGKWKNRTLQIINDRFRTITILLPWPITLLFSYLLAPLLPLAIKIFRYDLQQKGPSYKDCVYYLFDWLTPEYQWKHTNEELQQWCQKNSLRVLKAFDPPAGVLAIREE